MEFENLFLSRRPVFEHCKRWRKIQQTMFVWVCEQQTPKPEHGCKIKTNRFFGYQIGTPVGQVMVFLMVKKELKIL